MLSTFRRLGRAWLAAGWLVALAPALMAQQPGGNQPAYPAQAMTQPGEAQCRFDEMQIEIAWAADPLIFPYHLLAVCEGNVLKVYGSVPNDRVAERVLKTARDHASLEVVDVLQVRPGLSPRRSPVATAALQKTAERALTEAFPSQARNLTVQADATGRVAVSGQLASCEDRRTVSRRLKQVRGCTAVVNQVEVMPTQVQGMSCIRVTADGSLLLAAEQGETAPPPAPAAAPVARAVFGTPYSRVLPRAAALQKSGVVPAVYNQPAGADPGVVPARAEFRGTAPGAESAPDAHASPSRLKRCVERACGMAAHDIVVVSAPGGDGLFVRLKAHSEEDGERLLDELMQLPELAPYQVQFLVQVER